MEAKCVSWCVGFLEYIYNMLRK